MGLDQGKNMPPLPRRAITKTTLLVLSTGKKGVGEYMRHSNFRLGLLPCIISPHTITEIL